MWGTQRGQLCGTQEPLWEGHHSRAKGSAATVVELGAVQLACQGVGKGSAAAEPLAPAGSRIGPAALLWKGGAGAWQPCCSLWEGGKWTCCSVILEGGHSQIAKDSSQCRRPGTVVGLRMGTWCPRGAAWDKCQANVASACPACTSDSLGAVRSSCRWRWPAPPTVPS